ncbi:exodeoxyribonuclease VII large subunit [Aureibacillus halotolerans]|uniref:Exodeoxyribonuclease 7 large subunit n=1 Tax=Aureibacillus halotolerans TaxID=1508390 RepID=A0A4R6UEX3_9BACI|nr:exodeoxyribonuclease VII large subunit [Aureibacillus halotolerans]TDQ41644.1 exodeoxyribonuclease VII large subunit [Aureibacillus halotolerans]
MNENTLTVTAITKYIKKKFDVDRNLQDIWFRGELSNVKLHSRGHLYCTIKDDTARIQAVMFQTDRMKLSFEPENGMKVLVRGSISVYQPYGQYQTTVTELQPDGVGALHLAFEQLKEKLTQEGLFAQDRKKQLPLFPSTIGVVTSPTGAAIRDVLITLKRRFPSAQVLIYPVLVQGKNAAGSIVQALKVAQRQAQADVLIVGRGGGSIEELWAFNEEEVARTIANCSIPVISAVGHETDTTIADFVADVRAATPTGAAELAVPDMREWKQRTNDLHLRLQRATKQKIQKQSERLQRLQSSYAFKYPRQLVNQKQQELDRAFDDLLQIMKQGIHRNRMSQQQLAARLTRQSPQKMLSRAQEQQGKLSERLHKSLQSLLKDRQATIQEKSRQLDALSPLKVMSRGYSVVYNNGHVVTSVDHVHLDDELDLRVNGGHISTKVTSIAKEDTRDGQE